MNGGNSAYDPIDLGHILYCYITIHIKNEIG